MELTAERGVSMGERAAAGAGKRVWAGRVASGLAILFLAFDAVAKVLEVKPVLEGSLQLGYPVGTVFGIGVVLLACVVAHVVPRTAVVGAVLLTGYLGGAVASQVRVEAPLASHVLFPIYVAILIWGGLYLRDPRVRAVLAPRS